MTGRVLCCRDCGQPLRVVCPTHGTDTVAASWPDVRGDLPARALRPDTLRERLLFALPEAGTSESPSIALLALRLGVQVQHVRAELHALQERGLCHRVGRGRYVRGGRA
jgi:hypothetical protein